MVCLSVCFYFVNGVGVGVYTDVVCFGYLVAACDMEVYCTFGLADLCWCLCLRLVLHL